MESVRDQRKRWEKKIKESMKSGAGTDDVVKPTIWWYDLVGFLMKDAAPADTTDNLVNVTVSLMRQLPNLKHQRN